MKIVKIEITGFKSFKNSVSIYFNQGLTGIVGPNGCGKSNIIDAVLWVTGSTTAGRLRGGQMEDVIFGGTEKHPPSSFAEVSLTFEKTSNGEWPSAFQSLSELVISRKLKRGGDSQYFVNGEACLLRNIQELLNDVGAMGFSVIEQDTISKIISYKPDQLRELIDQTAGVLPFKNKKRAAQNKMKNLSHNILRIEDLLQEQGKHLKKLEKQSRQAQLYKELKDQLSFVETRILKKQYLEVCSRIQDNARQLQSALQEEGSYKNSLKFVEPQYQNMRKNLDSMHSGLELKRKELSQKREELAQCEVEVQKLRVSIDSESGYIHHLAGSISEFKQYCQDKEKEVDVLKNQIQKEQSQLSFLQTDLEQKSAGLEKIKLQVSLIQKEKDSQEPVFENCFAEEIRVREALNSLDRDQIRLKALIQGVQEEIKKEEERISALKRSCRQMRRKIDEDSSLHLNLQEEIKSQKENILQTASLKAQTEKDLKQVSKSLIQRESRKKSFISFKKQMGPAADGYEWVRKEKPFKVLYEVLDIESEYEPLVSSVLAQKFYAFLLEDPQTAVELLQDVHSQSLTGVCLLLAQKPPPQPRLKIKGVECVLRDKVQLKTGFEKYSQLLDFLLGRAAVVDSIRGCLPLCRQHSDAVFVDKRGDVFHNNIIFSRGSSSMPRWNFFDEAENLTSQIESIKKEEGFLEKRFLDQTQKLKNLKKHLDHLNQKRHLGRQSMQNEVKNIELLEKEQAFLQCSLQKLYKQKQDQESELKGAVKTLEDQKKHYENLQQQLKDEQRKWSRVSQNLIQSGQKKDKAEKSLESVQLQYLSLKKDLKSKQDRQIMLEQSIDDMSRKEQAFLKKSNQNQKAVKKNESHLMNAQTHFDQKKKIYHQKQQEEQSLTVEYQEKSLQCKNLEKQAAELGQSVTAAGQKKIKLEAAAENLCFEKKNFEEKAFENYQIELKDHEAAALDLEPPAESASQLKLKISQIGQVNLLALSEYEELSKENQEMQSQYSDLEQSRKDLEKVIDEMDRISDKQFKKAFEEVNARLLQVFKTVFNGGKAGLVLTDKNFSESGVEIWACPPGKKLKNLKLLSGGEKTLTALSMVLALFLVRPAPFCILDEVDAALDDRNVVCFNSLILEIAQKCQVILVTHNKYSMKECHRLYGATMEEKGVTQLLSVDMQKNPPDLSV